MTGRDPWCDAHEAKTLRDALALVLAEIWAPDGGQAFQRLGAIRAAEAGLRGDGTYIAARREAPLIASGMARALEDGNSHTAPSESGEASTAASMADPGSLDAGASHSQPDPCP